MISIIVIIVIIMAIIMIAICACKKSLYCLPWTMNIFSWSPLHHHHHCLLSYPPHQHRHHRQHCHNHVNLMNQFVLSFPQSVLILGPKERFYAYLRHFAWNLGTFMLIICIFTLVFFSEAESTFVLIHTLFACPAITVSAFQRSSCRLPWTTSHLHDHHNLHFDYRQTFQIWWYWWHWLGILTISANCGSKGAARMKLAKLVPLVLLVIIITINLVFSLRIVIHRTIPQIGYYHHHDISWNTFIKEI